jgi:hypothetical protein
MCIKATIINRQFVKYSLNLISSNKRLLTAVQISTTLNLKGNLLIINYYRRNSENVYIKILTVQNVFLL